MSSVLRECFAEVARAPGALGDAACHTHEPPDFGPDATTLNVFYLHTENGNTVVLGRATVPRN